MFVVDGDGTIPSVTDELEREGYSVTVCPSEKAETLMNGLVEKGTNLVYVSVSSPLAALALLRAAFTVCSRARSRPGERPVGFLTPAAGASRADVARS